MAEKEEGWTARLHAPDEPHEPLDEMLDEQLDEVLGEPLDEWLDASTERRKWSGDSIEAVERVIKKDERLDERLDERPDERLDERLDEPVARDEDAKCQMEAISGTENAADEKRREYWKAVERARAEGKGEDEGKDESDDEYE